MLPQTLLKTITERLKRMKYSFRSQIFETERIASKKAFWHKKCFCCFKCKRPLDSRLNYTYDAPDGEIYCKGCLKKAFPEAETPLTYSDVSVIKPAGEDGGCPRCEGAVFQVNEERTIFLSWFAT